ncbi:thiamine-phosphate synthase family protein [Haloarchaeobius sp. HRN-SO-5]|uniref:thiamine-phosphate synthase family protein n=1 Tax=Haloarchaeobius sp. HRN-SO-5 TaxID=3446118 RepID=UPI003EB9A852
MPVVLPSEIVVERFLPTARAMLVAELAERGLTQREVADHLGVTQAAVSKYRSGDVTVEERFSEDARMVATIERVADGLADGGMDHYEALAELVALVEEFEDRGPICAVHEDVMPALRGMGCDLCVRGPDSGLLAEREVLSTVREAVRTLSGSPSVVDHVPNVGTNVAMALPDAEDVGDVAAIPGRLHAIRGRLDVPGSPEFGASQHVATVVLAATATDPETRGAVNLRTTPELLEAVREAGLDPLSFDADYEGRARRLRERFAEAGVPRVAYHEGDYGVEPILYVLGPTAVDAVDLAVDLCDRADA